MNNIRTKILKQFI